MNWRNIKTVWNRELRDQLRDRRTLFMVLVLPLLMYPLMGMSFFQLAQFLRTHTATVLVVGADQLATVQGLPPLVDGERFSKSLFDPPEQAAKLVVEDGDKLTDNKELSLARERLAAGDLDAVVLFPLGFADRLEALRQDLSNIGTDGDNSPGTRKVPRPQVLYNSSRDASQVAFLRVERLLGVWRQRIVGKNLAQANVPTTALQPFQLSSQDMAEPSARRAGIWSKLLPFVVFVWALTGAFYPAVDLCAGEKERGTLETLLASPASRGEIVWGKLLTVMTFSIMTAMLNLVGIGFTGGFISQQLATAGSASAASGLGMPPISSLGWLLIALPPVAALFSALSFACASFARSTKEGQYYFMPLFLATMPLMLMPLSPGVELNLGNSLAPVMGLALLLRSLMEGDFLEAVRYAVPVTLVTLGCCLLATRWAVAQFNQESVLFRGDERFDLRLWIHSVLRRRHATPTAAMAVTCVALILVLQFAVQTVAPSFMPPGALDFGHFAVLLVVSQLCVLLPSLLLTLGLTTQPRQTFLLGKRPWSFQLMMIPLGALLAVCLHPLGIQITLWIQQLYPPSEELLKQAQEMNGLVARASSPWIVVGLLGLLPAVVEELTFRGTVLTGLRSAGSTRWAIVLSAVAFGAVHSVFQQSLSAALIGVLIGYLAVVTRSLAPCIAFHGVYNSLPVLTGYYAVPLAEWLENTPYATNFVRLQEQQLAGYQPVVVLAATAVAGLVLWGVRQASLSPPSSLNKIGPSTSPLSGGLVPSETTEG